jgi:hypothetical protein
MNNKYLKIIFGIILTALIVYAVFMTLDREAWKTNATVLLCGLECCDKSETKGMSQERWQCQVDCYHKNNIRLKQ